MADDTVYFLAFEEYDIAYAVMLLLNSEPVRKYLMSIAFLDSKRPYTVKLLSRLDLKKCAAGVSFDEIVHTEKKLHLPQYVDPGMYELVKEYIWNR